MVVGTTQRLDEKQREIAESQRVIESLNQEGGGCRKCSYCDGRARCDFMNTNPTHLDTAKLRRAIVAMKRLSTSASTERKELEQLASEQRTVIARLRRDLASAKETKADGAAEYKSVLGMSSAQYAPSMAGTHCCFSTVP